MTAIYSYPQTLTTSQALSNPQSWKRSSAQAAKALKEVLAPYTPITLAEMEAATLLRRVDTKYLLHVQELVRVLADLRGCYRVLEVRGQRLHHYHNLYFDTPDLALYHQHHNQQRDRYKVRCREYVDTGLTFLEVKRKNNRDQTIKSREKTAAFVSQLPNSSDKLLSESYPYEAGNLRSVLWNDFNRVTLVSKRTLERLTLDINLGFSNGWEQVGLPGVAVVEVKQEHFSIHSDIIKSMRALKIQPRRFSKYCLGIPRFYPQVKHNRFKPRTLLVDYIMAQGGNHEPSN